MIKKNRFTAVELMVVITIILLVATILFGAFGRARHSAEKVLCASNLGQLNVGYTFYASASKGEYPPFAWIMNSNGKLGDNDDKLFGGDPPQGKGSGLLQKVEGGSWLDSSMVPLMKCPSDESPELRVYSTQINPSFTLADFENTTSYLQTKSMGNGLVEVESSYGYNLNLGLYEVIMLGLNDPSGMLVNFDATSLLGDNLKTNGASKPDLTDMSNIVSNVFEARHLDEANMLFGDGHVEQSDGKEIPESLVITDNWRVTGEGYFGNTSE